MSYHKLVRWMLLSGMLATCLRVASADELLPIVDEPPRGRPMSPMAGPAARSATAPNRTIRPHASQGGGAIPTEFTAPRSDDMPPIYGDSSMGRRGPARKSTRVGSIDQVSANEPTLAEGERIYDGPINVGEGTDAPVDEGFVDYGMQYGHDEGVLPVLSSGEWFRNACWYGEFDFVVYHRSRVFGQYVAQDVANLSNTNFTFVGIATQEMGIDLASGGRVVIGAYTGRDLENRDYSYEFGFLGLGTWTGQAGITAQVLSTETESGAGSLVVPGQSFLAGFTGADTISETFSSQISSYEFNTKIHKRLSPDNMVMAPDGTWTRQASEGYLGAFLLGLRAFSIDERYTLTGRRVNLSPSQFGGDFDISTDNALLGLQGGGEFYDQHADWYWGVRGKMGAFANFANAKTTASFVDNTGTGIGPPTSRSYEVDRQVPAFMLEFSLMAGYYVSPNFVVRTSYDMLWLTNFASAPDQLAYNNPVPPTVYNTGDMFVQGLSVGFEYFW